MSKVTKIHAEYYDHTYRPTEPPRRTDWREFARLIAAGVLIWLVVAGLLWLTTIVFGGPAQ